MKKLLAIAFMSALVLSACTKKETEVESNTMLPEPEMSTTMPSDSMTKMDSTPVATPMVKDSAMTK